MYAVTRSIIRIAILIFYARLFVTPLGQKLVCGTFVLTISYGIAFVLVIVFQCSPISLFWLQWDGEHAGQCINTNLMAWIAAGTGFIVDIWMMGFPLLFILPLNLHWKKKAAVGFTFALGLLYVFLFCLGCFRASPSTGVTPPSSDLGCCSVIAISAYRIKFLNKFSRTVNPTRKFSEYWRSWRVWLVTDVTGRVSEVDFVPVGVWSSIEIDVGVVVACLPSIRALLVKLFPSFSDSRQHGFAPSVTSFSFRHSTTTKPRPCITVIKSFESSNTTMVASRKSSYPDEEEAHMLPFYEPGGNWI